MNVTETRFLLSAAVGAALVLAVPVAQATDFTWVGAEDTASGWTASANWQVGGESTESYPQTASDKAIFPEGKTVIVDYALGAFPGASVSVSVGAGGVLTVKDSGATAHTLSCAPSLATGAKMVFDHAILSTTTPRSADAACRYEFINAAAWNPGWVCAGSWSGKGTLYFKDSNFGFSDQMPLNWGTSSASVGYELVLVDSHAGGPKPPATGNLGKSLQLPRALCLTNSVLTMRKDAGGIVGLLNVNSQIIVSGNDSSIDCYELQMKNGGTLVFDYTRADRAAISVNGVAFAPNATSKLVVQVTEKPAVSTDVILMACANGMTVPEGWLTKNADLVTADEYVKRIYTTEVSGVTYLMATLTKPSTEVTPSGRFSVAGGVAGAHAKAFSVIVDDRGVGATKTSVTLKLYSDSARTQLVQTKTVAADRTDESYSVDTTLDNLTIDANYYVDALIANDLDKEVVLQDSFRFEYPLAENGVYGWTGWGGDGKWTTSANWGVREGYPKTSSDTATFPAGSSFAFDVVQDLSTVSGVKIKVLEGGSLTLSNANVAPATFSCTPTLSANATMTFDNVNLSGMANSLDASATYRFVNGSTYQLGWFTQAIEARGLWYFEDAAFVCTDQMPLGTVPNGKSSTTHDIVLVNSTCGGEKAKNLTVSRYLFLTNSTLTMRTGEAITAKGSAKKIIVSGNGSSVNAGKLEVSQSATLEFEYGRLDRAAIQLGSNGFTTDATSKLVVTRPDTQKRAGDVILLSTTGTMTVPSSWTEMNPDYVTVSKGVTRIFTEEVEGVRYLKASMLPKNGIAVILR